MPTLPGYDGIAKVTGTQELFVTQFVAAPGHCQFTPAQLDTAFERLLEWVRERKKPEAGEIK